jgi:hypothetical protein
MRTVTVRLNSDNQITVGVGTESRTGECYYLGLHQGGSHGDYQPLAGTARLLRSWLSLVCGLRDGDPLFLPFDFSDEYTRWLALQRTADEVTVVTGWAAIEGWAISPADFSEFAHGLPGFMPDEPLVAQSFYLPRVLSDLRHSLAVLESQRDTTGRDD